MLGSYLNYNYAVPFLSFIFSYFLRFTMYKESNMIVNKSELSCQWKHQFGFLDLISRTQESGLEIICLMYVYYCRCVDRLWTDFVKIFTEPVI